MSLARLRAPLLVSLAVGPVLHLRHRIGIGLDDVPAHCIDELHEPLHRRGVAERPQRWDPAGAFPTSTAGTAAARDAGEPAQTRPPLVWSLGSAVLFSAVALASLYSLLSNG